jgi:tRNA(fMet)-specific endonuclease VapC
LSAPILVDTSVLIAAVRAERSVAEVVAPGTEVAVSVVTIMEYERGVERAAGARQRRLREAFRDQLRRLDTLPIDVDVAIVAAQVWVDLERRGTPIPAFDLLIAATALSAGCTLLTADARHFSRVEELDVRLVEAA